MIWLKMKNFVISMFGIVGFSLAMGSFAQGVNARGTTEPDRREILTCSPAPCILPPVEASEGGFEVADAPIAADPRNPKHLIVGSDDFNCPGSSLLGFHVSRDGGST